MSFMDFAAKNWNECARFHEFDGTHIDVVLQRLMPSRSNRVPKRAHTHVGGHSVQHVAVASLRIAK